MANWKTRTETVQVIDVLGLKPYEATRIEHALRKHAAVVGHELNLPTQAREYEALADLFGTAARSGA